VWWPPIGGGVVERELKSPERKFSIASIASIAVVRQIIGNSLLVKAHSLSRSQSQKITSFLRSNGDVFERHGVLPLSLQNVGWVSAFTLFVVGLDILSFRRHVISPLRCYTIIIKTIIESYVKCFCLYKLLDD